MRPLCASAPTQEGIVRCKQIEYVALALGAIELAGCSCQDPALPAPGDLTVPPGLTTWHLAWRLKDWELRNTSKPPPMTWHTGL